MGGIQLQMIDAYCNTALITLCQNENMTLHIVIAIIEFRCTNRINRIYLDWWQEWKVTCTNEPAFIPTGASWLLVD